MLLNLLIEVQLSMEISQLGESTYKQAKYI